MYKYIYIYICTYVCMHEGDCSENSTSGQGSSCHVLMGGRNSSEEYEDEETEVCLHIWIYL
jgi:hypothetical protein